MRKVVTVLVVLAVGLFVYKKTTFGSYAGTLWSQVKKEASEQVPTKFEIERVRHEIANLDSDISGMFRPIAEYTAAITGLKKDIQTTQTRLHEQKDVLLTMTRDLEGNPSILKYDGVDYTSERVKSKLQADFESYKRLESHHATQQKLLEAKETSLKATHEQLARVVAKKREYELRLAQLETAEEALKVARIGNSPQIDATRATEIEKALANIEHRHNVEKAEHELKSGAFANDNIPVQKGRPVDVQTIRNYLQAGTALNPVEKKVSVE